MTFAFATPRKRSLVIFNTVLRLFVIVALMQTSFSKAQTMHQDKPDDAIFEQTIIRLFTSISSSLSKMKNQNLDVTDIFNSSFKACDMRKIAYMINYIQKSQSVLIPDRDGVFYYKINGIDLTKLPLVSNKFRTNNEFWLTIKKVDSSCSIVEASVVDSAVPF